MSAIFLCGPDTCGHGECQNCGGSATLGGTQEALHTPEGIFCSTECHDEAIEFQDRAKREDAYRRGEWCPECGFDRFEHQGFCSKAKP